MEGKTTIALLTGRRLAGARKPPRKPRTISAADRVRIVLESLEDGAVVATVARRNRVDPRALSRWRGDYRAGTLRGAGPEVQSVPIAELAAATQRIRDLERELGRMALENAMLLEAVQFVGSPATTGERAAPAKKRKKPRAVSK